MAGNPSEVQLLRGLIYLFPAFGTLAIVLALVHGAWQAGRRLIGILVAVSGLVPLIALAVGPYLVREGYFRGSEAQPSDPLQRVR